MRVPAGIALALLLAAPCLGGPAEAVASAAADLSRQPEGLRPYLRYLSAYHLSGGALADLDRALAFHANSLSREAEIVRPAQAQADLWRVNLKDYAWDAKVWDRLARADPYFHAAIQVERAQEEGYWPGGVDPKDGKYYGPGYYYQAARKKKIAAAPWLPAKESAYLIEATQSEAPILRADWFIAQTAIQKDRVAGYYDFLELGKKEADFQALCGVDVDLARKVKREIAAAVGKSGVTLNNRGVERFGAVTGGYWRTQDFKTSVKLQNTLRLLDQDREPPHGDASEQYGTLPNGLFAFWLQDANGNRQDAAPDFIASDNRAPGNDRRVHVGVSCVRCHVEGIRPIDDWARRVYRGAIQLQSVDYDRLKRLRQLYLSDLEGHVRRDQEYYAEVLKAVNGLTPRENAELYARVWEKYVEAELAPQDCARELGMEEPAFLGALKVYAQTSGQLDPVLAGLLQDPPLPIRREHWEEVYPVAQATVKGYLLKERP